jgi:hypothetical protein
MLPDSTNVGIIAENIKKLETMVQEAGSKLPTPEAGDAGKILKVGSDGYELATEYSYTPPAYSTEEVNTGQKWIDGRYVYRKVFTNLSVSVGLSWSVIGEINSNYIINVICNYSGTCSNYYLARVHQGNLELYSARSQETTVGTVIAYYLKQATTPNVVPSPENDTRSVEPIEEVTEEPVETKTKKKTSKKGE